MNKFFHAQHQSIKNSGAVNNLVCLSAESWYIAAPSGYKALHINEVGMSF